MENNSFLFSLVFIYLISLQHITYANYNQIEILDDFRLSARQYTELLKTIITESEISQDSGDVNGTFFIKSV